MFVIVFLFRLKSKRLRNQCLNNLYLEELKLSYMMNKTNAGKKIDLDNKSELKRNIKIRPTGLFPHT